MSSRSSFDQSEKVDVFDQSPPCVISRGMSSRSSFDQSEKVDVFDQSPFDQSEKVDVFDQSPLISPKKWMSLISLFLISPL